VIIRALSVFERVIYHCVLVDPAHPCRPTLEVEAVLREGDDDGPLLLPLADYITLAGGPDHVAGCLPALRDKGRFADHLGVAHLAFPFWTPVHIDRLAGLPSEPPGLPPAAPLGDAAAPPRAGRAPEAGR
jgi:hypothetical protein